MTFIDEESFEEEKDFNDWVLIQENVAIDQYGFVYDKNKGSVKSYKGIINQSRN